MRKTPPKGSDAEGSPRSKAPRVDDAAWTAASTPSPTGKTPPKGAETEGSPRKKTLPQIDLNLPTAPQASEPNPTGKTPSKGDETEGSPRKETLPQIDLNLPTAPQESEPNPTGKTPRKGDEAKASPPKRSRSPRNSSPRQQDKRPAAAVPLATVPESSELIVQGAGRANDKKRCKCNRVVITESAIKESNPFLKYKDAFTCFICWDEDQKGIVKIRPEKSDILMCVTCGYHLCCGVGEIAHPFGHSRAHAQEKEHWFAVLYCDPQRGFCFKCDAEVPMAAKFVSRKLLALPPLVGQTEAEKVEMIVKVQAESHPSESRSSDAQGDAIRGIKNLGNTCYMSAVLQCLFVLGKLRERMLADHPKGLVPEVLKELLVEASAAGDVLNPTKVLTCVRLGKEPSMAKAAFQVGSMEDSHEFLNRLLNLWIEGEKAYDRQSNAPTLVDSIFRVEMLQILVCKKCGPCLSAPTFLDLKLDFPPKWHQRNLEKMQTVSESGNSPVIVSEVIVEKTHKPLQVDSTCQSKDVVQSPLQIKEAKSVDSLTEDSISIESLLSLFSKDEMNWICDNCPKDHKEPSANQSKNSEQIVGSSKKNDVGNTFKTFHFLTLPPVLTLHLNRTSHLIEGGNKINGHVRFMEYLDVERFMVPRSAKNCSTLYRLAGVVEHIGKGSLKEENGHYVAYVRARRLGNQQESSSCSSSWFLASDSQITRVSLSEVLKKEAYILFYERMEGQDTSSEVKNAVIEQADE